MGLPGRDRPSAKERGDRFATLIVAAFVSLLGVGDFRMAQNGPVSHCLSRRRLAPEIILPFAVLLNAGASPLSSRRGLSPRWEAASPSDRQKPYEASCPRWSFARDAPFQGVHQVHDIDALRSRLGPDGLAVPFGVDEFGQGRFVVVLELLGLEGRGLLVDDMLRQIEHVLGDPHVLDVVEVFLLIPNFVGIPEKRPVCTENSIRRGRSKRTA
jgi:hypothetical protein